MFVSQEYVQSTMDDAVHDDRLEDMIRDVGVESFAEAHGYESIVRKDGFKLEGGGVNCLKRFFANF